MFTGIVQGLVPVKLANVEGGVLRLELAMGALSEGLELGASVAVNGTCLTVTKIGDAVSFDVISETLSNTNLGALQPEALVNVERSFKVGDEVGGHILSGHVSGVVTVAEIVESEGQRDIIFDVPDRWMKYLQHKGFAALDGASLTLATVDRPNNQISVCLIPETIERTTLGRVTIGDLVNLEVDAQTQTIVETVERVLAERTAE